MTTFRGNISETDHGEIQMAEKKLRFLRKPACADQAITISTDAVVRRHRAVCFSP